MRVRVRACVRVRVRVRVRVCVCAVGCVGALFVWVACSIVCFDACLQTPANSSQAAAAGARAQNAVQQATRGIQNPRLKAVRLQDLDVARLARADDNTTCNIQNTAFENAPAGS